MNDMPNPPMPPPPAPPSPMMEPAAPTPFFQVWMNALTKPNEATFAQMASSPNAKATPAFLWIFLVSLVQSFVLFLVQGSVFRRMLEQQGLGNQLPNQGFGGSLIQLICGAPISAVISVVAFAIVTALVQWIAKMFGGRGTFDQLAYVFGAIAAPAALITTVLTLLGAIPFVGLCFAIISFLVGIYVLVLEIMATKAVNGFGWGPAVGSVLIPVAVLILIACCLGFGLAALIGASLGNVFSGMGPFPIPTP